MVVEDDVKVLTCTSYHSNVHRWEDEVLRMGSPWPENYGPHDQDLCDSWV